MNLLALFAVGGVITLAAGLVGTLFVKVWTTPGRVRSLAARLALTCFTLLYTWLALDLTLYCFYVQPDAIDVTLSSKRWNDRYWKPINSRGYRDYEFSAAQLHDRQDIVVVGDSFAAGHGIESINDRFSGVLQRLCGDRANVLTVAQKGWGTSEEMQGLVKLVGEGIKPSLVVWSFCLNDVIEGMPDTSSVDRRVLPGMWHNPVIHLSPTANFAYWRIYRSRNVDQLLSGYWELLDECYTDPQIWGNYERRFSEYLRRTQDYVPVLVLVFPNLRDISKSLPYTTKVCQLLDAHRIPYIDLAKILNGRDPDALILNRFDDHPSAALHAEIGQLIYERLTKR